ncbi:helix-turn-helix domain-containing protein [Mariniplasma anaerobium]|uniref:Transposase n=1 Tax=Mariniplasma anaerobium TaxID=2735436 RepID=A0A7U9XUE5_9MOLU|nr:helix-turn-helix domain-containing protein [Mariniplasma anaerobium]BCR35321.1 hypothetical protein MPAN_002140 [Mariniplasma anaerobium]BCR35571.1 hypothetical protein MPAN_004640 [Mariniplasma anaerobium]
MSKHYTNRARLDAVKNYRASNLSLSEFARQHKFNRSTLKDWVAAFNHLEGDFIRIDNISDRPGELINEENIRLNMLKGDEITKKSTHFSRFDHSIVVIESKQIKITTSLEQALKILEVIYD